MTDIAIDPLDRPSNLRAYDRQGERLPTLRAYIKAFESDRSVARDTVTVGGDELTVSTVFLVLDHGFMPGGRPVLFETMVFGNQYDGECDRYHTEEEARAGHERVVARLRAGENPWGDDDA